MASIFVQIACYRDKELLPTIKNALTMSSKKHTINFGVYICSKPEDKLDLPDFPSVKYDVDVAPGGIGLGKARSLAHQFYSGEDYYLQIDAHSRFVPNWDEKVIHSVLNYQIMGIEKPLITTYPAGYKYTSLSKERIKCDPIGLPTLISFYEKPEQFSEIRIPSQTAVGNPSNSIFTKSVSGGSIFTVGSFIEPNVDIAFYGEEIYIAAVAYTNGFDLMVPHEMFMYHLYYDHSSPEMNSRAIVWNDFPGEFSRLDAISKAEIYNTLVNGTTGRYRLGTKRTIEEYGNFCGLDFKNGKLLEEC